MKKDKIMFGVLLVLIFVLTVGLTIAYFSLTVLGNENAENIVVQGSTLSLNYSDGAEIMLDGLMPGDTFSKTVTVTNTGTVEVYYDFGWQNIDNTILKNEMTVSGTCVSSGIENGSCENIASGTKIYTNTETAPAGTVIDKIKEAVAIKPNEVHTYNLTFTFIETNAEQNYNQGKHFGGKLGVAETNARYNLTFNLKDTGLNTLNAVNATMASIPQTKTVTNGEVTFEGIEPGNHTLTIAMNANDRTQDIVVPVTLVGGNESIGNMSGERIVITPKHNYNEAAADIIVNTSEKSVTNVDVKKALAETCEGSTLAECLIENANTLGITRISQAATGNQNYETVEYRYQGKTPNNYVTFNGEKWRIIGVFETQRTESSAKEYRVKIIRDASIGSLYWNKIQDTGKNWNYWPTSTLAKMLNGSEDERDGAYFYRKSATTEDVATFNPCSNDNGVCDYSSNGLTVESRNMIDTAVWYINPASRTTNTINTYKAERNGSKWTGTVGLMYPSDYMYASNVCSIDTTVIGYDETNSNDYRLADCKNTNWLFNSAYQWTIAPYSGSTNLALTVSSSGNVGYNNNVNSYAHGVRPVTYLKSEVVLTGAGRGDTNHPYSFTN